MRLLQSVRLVRVIDEHRRAIAVADQIEPPLGALERSQRREHAVRRATGRNRKTCGHQCVLDLKAADQRQPELMLLAGVHRR